MPSPLAVAVVGAVAGWVGYKLEQNRQLLQAQFPSVPESWWKGFDDLGMRLKWRALATLGKNDEVRALLTRFVDENPKVGCGYAYLASMHVQKHDWPAALEIASQHLLVEPDHPVAVYYYAACQSGLGNDDAAERHWLRFLELEPTSSLTGVARSALTRLENRRKAAEPAVSEAKPRTRPARRKRPRSTPS